MAALQLLRSLGLWPHPHDNGRWQLSGAVVSLGINAHDAISMAAESDAATDAPATPELPEAKGATSVPATRTRGLGSFTFHHPGSAFSITPASDVSLEAVLRHQDRLKGVGLDWGCGCGALAIAASRVPSVTRVYGLDIMSENIEAARANAAANSVPDAKAKFYVGDSTTVVDAAEAAEFKEAVSAAGGLSFVLANPPASEPPTDGFEWRRRVVRDTAPLMAAGGILLLQVSIQYGRRRVMNLERDAPGWRFLGLAASSRWVPFDMRRKDVFNTVTTYAKLEARRDASALPYEFARRAVVAPEPGSGGDGGGQFVSGDSDTGLLPDDGGVRADALTSATEAMATWEESAESPMSKWQVFCFEWRPDE